MIKRKRNDYYKLPWLEQVRFHFNNLTRLQKITYYAFAAPMLCLDVIGILLFFVGGFPWSFNATKTTASPLLQKVALFDPSGEAGSRDGDAATATFNQPGACAVDSDDNVYIVDAGNQAIRMISSSNSQVTTVPIPTSSLIKPKAIAVYRKLLFVTDEGDNSIKLINITSGSCQVFAGSSADTQASTNSYRLAVALNQPSSLWISKTSILVSDTKNNLIRSINDFGIVETFAGVYRVSETTAEGVHRQNQSFNM